MYSRLMPANILLLRLVKNADPRAGHNVGHSQLFAATAVTFDLDPFRKRADERFRFPFGSGLNSYLACFDVDGNHLAGPSVAERRQFLLRQRMAREDESKNPSR